MAAKQTIVKIDRKPKWETMTINGVTQWVPTIYEVTPNEKFYKELGELTSTYGLGTRVPNTRNWVVKADGTFYKVLSMLFLSRTRIVVGWPQDDFVPTGAPSAAAVERRA